MENVIIIKTTTDPNFADTTDNLLIKNIADGRLYIGNGTNIADEIKTDKSNNWAKMFFYGSS